MAERTVARERLAAWLRGAPPPTPADAAEEAALLAEAGHQGLLGRLARAVVEADAAWPSGARLRLAQEQRRLLVRGVRMLDAAARLLEVLHTAGVRALPLKGAALAGSVYPIESDRPMDDVDLLVLDRWPEAVAALGAQGLVLDERADHAWRFRDPATRLAVELHHSVTSCPGFYPLDADGLWERSAAGAGLPRLPAQEDLLVQLALHAAFQHGLAVALVHLLDFRQLFEMRPPAAAATLARARSARAEAPLWAALQAARAVGAQPPESLLRELEATLPQPVARWMSHRQASAPGAGPLRARWALTAGRRREWLVRTLAPAGPGTPTTRAGRLLGVARRGPALLFRWGRRGMAATAAQPPARSDGSARDGG